MSTLARKQKERAQREQLFLESARRIFIQEGYLELNMDRVAEACEYSKGTIYQHFSSKEDLIGALSIQSHAIRLNMFQRGTTFKGRSRERMTAMGVADDLFVKLYPDHLRFEQILSVSSIMDKLSEERRLRMVELQDRAMETVQSVVDEAIAEGDLILPEGINKHQLLFGLWTMTIGTRNVENSEQACGKFPALNLNDALWANYQILLDGYGWAPLSTKWDYETTIGRIRTEVFKDEWKKVQP